MINTKFLKCSPLIFFRNFATYAFYAWNNNSHHGVENQENNLAIFGPFLDRWDFFKNRGLTLEASDFDFCDLLDELSSSYHMAE